MKWAPHSPGPSQEGSHTEEEDRVGDGGPLFSGTMTYGELTGNSVLLKCEGPEEVSEQLSHSIRFPTVEQST